MRYFGGSILNVSAVKGKVVIITGASSGIGKALAYKFHAEGSHLVLAARSADKLASIQADLNPEGQSSVHCVPTDVTSKDDCDRLVAETVRQFGKVDILINNAGISMRALVKDLDVSVIEKVMQVNFFGTVYCTKAALPEIMKNKGAIVGVSSIAGFRGLPARSGYSSSKFAMHGFLESLRTELLEKGVHVLLACPGFTASNIRNTALTEDGSPQGKTPLSEQNLMTAEEVADHIYKALIRKKRTIVLTRQGKLTVFMNKLFPKWMDKMVLNHFKKEPDSPLK